MSISSPKQQLQQRQSSCRALSELWSCKKTTKTTTTTTAIADEARNVLWSSFATIYSGFSSIWMFLSLSSPRTSYSSLTSSLDHIFVLSSCSLVHPFNKNFFLDCCLCFNVYMDMGERVREWASESIKWILLHTFGGTKEENNKKTWRKIMKKKNFCYSSQNM